MEANETTPEQIEHKPGPYFTEEQLWSRCQDILMFLDFQAWAIDSLIALLWSVTHRPSLIGGVDLADNLIERLYGATRDCDSRRKEYLATLPGKTYRIEVESDTAELTARPLPDQRAAGIPVVNQQPKTMEELV